MKIGGFPDLTGAPGRAAKSPEWIQLARIMIFFSDSVAGLETGGSAGDRSGSVPSDLKGGDEFCMVMAQN